MPLLKLLFPMAVMTLILAILINIPENEVMEDAEMDFMNGVSFVAPPGKFSSNPFLPLLNINADWVGIMPYAFSRENEPEVWFDVDRQWWGEKTEGTIETIRLAKQNGLKILLKPHIWVIGQGWTGDYQLENERDWEIWESYYEKYIMHYANIADSMNVEAFCVGLEFKHVVRQRPEYWIRLINKVKQEYNGKITYAANWDNYKHVTFWDQVDFIGINAYFPLSQERSPSLETLKELWKKEKEYLHDLSETYGKSIVFTEFGYRSMDKAAGNQWELEDHRRYTGAANLEIQKTAYEALFVTFWNEPWFQGGFLWKWYHDGHWKYDPNDSDYTPQKKPTEKVIRDWYKKR